jgi:hypothetical protein
MWKNAVEDNKMWRMRFACWITKATYTLRISNTYCFCTATMVTRTRLNIALYIHCLSCSVTFFVFQINVFKEISSSKSVCLLVCRILNRIHSSSEPSVSHCPKSTKHPVSGTRLVTIPTSLTALCSDTF